MTRPPPQTNLEEALRLGFERLRARSASALASLGGRELGSGRWELAVLDAAFVLDIGRETCALAGGAPVRPAWQVLAVHYLLAEPPPERAARWVVFAELEPAARVYDQVHRGRVIGRLARSAGATREKFGTACRAAGGGPVDGLGDAGFEFRVFPELTVRIAWHAGDEELPSAISVLYPERVTGLLPLEDVVVLSERLAGRLEGRGW